MLLFRWRGVPVVADRLFVLLATLWLGMQAWRDGAVGLVSGLAGVVLLFGSVLAHEFGHAVVAQRFGVRVRQITLNIFGGVTQFERAGLSPRVDLFVSLGGPVTSLVLAAVCGALSALTGSTLLALVAAANLALGLFNMVPAFPLDGGRVLRAFLEVRLGVLRGSLIALRVGTVLAWAMLAGAVVMRDPGLGIVSALLLMMQRQERARLASMVEVAWR